MFTVLFEGVDCSGKSTLRAQFEKFTRYKYVTMDRGHISVFVYGTERFRTAVKAMRDADILLCQKTTLDLLDLCGTLENMQDHLVIVRVVASDNTIMSRVGATQHQPFDLATHKALFALAFDTLHTIAPNVSIIEINTSVVDYSHDNAINAILERIDALQQNELNITEGSVHHEGE